ncbi:hypothetical protein B1R32_104109 [Abditibacterium utsteinense]|uniref:Uncharacterized protein n=1 Tax=Abditibacterium utsteinense TaxID=1960156 RepID=A0A2S8SV06_9BACT|nr:hypothetical protein [Abditibacterium utsteinense]PQV64616.1 hypothetical protein B1R32_104109 [Abditibacterium utsteinense]
MAGYQDPYSGFFNLPTMLWCAFAGFMLLVMLVIFIGFDNGGFLHKVERRFGIRNMEKPEEDDI